jgi:protein-S-isoprenylcysteine O-methyltransferase Ste14
LGISIEFICERQIKSAKKKGDNLITSGLWSYLRHPNLVGLLLMFSGLHVLALSGVGSQWSILGLMVTILIIYKKLIPQIERHLLTKYPEYQK